MKISVIAPSEIDEGARATWRAMQQSNPALASPYFSPEFTMTAAAVRDDVRVAVLEEGARVVAYFPFQRGPWGACQPVGGLLSDHHGVIADARTTWSWQDILRAARLDHWRFDHLVAAQAPARVTALRASASPALDLSKGFVAYRTARVRDSRRIGDLDRKGRKLAREVGPLRFEAYATDAQKILQHVIAWKSEQCLRTGVNDFFALGWTRALVERVLETREPGFTGALSALYAGDTLVAANMGMHSERAWHWWFPVYEHAHAKCSPGALLLLRVAEAAAERGVSVLDLGKGDDGYKDSFADITFPLAEGFVARPSLLNAARSGIIRGEQWLRSSALFDPLRTKVRQLRRLRDGGAHLGPVPATADG